MTEDEFLERWNRERPMFEAWGQFVARCLTAEIAPLVAPVSTDIFIRIPVTPRLKSDGSFITKAFYRPEKNYTDPLEQITDKVGVRFVVLLASDIPIICDAIEKCAEWESSKDKDFDEERDKAPYEFRYQSVHYIVRCRGEKRVGERTVTAGAPCEVQVRTLLQHAHSELTHDTIYKPSVVQTPAMLRAAAKSMALIEATSDYFEELVHQISQSVGPNRKLTQELACVYRDAVGRDADATRAEGLLNEAYVPLAGENALAEVREFLNDKTFVPERIRDRAQSKLLFRQPSILLVYMVVSKRPSDAEAAWPLTPAELKPIYTDLGQAAPAG
jgi:putative GTP pyrophosphokinase